MKKSFLLLLFSLFALPLAASAELITKDTRWSGAVTLADDVLVCKGATLTISAGTKILFEEATSTKTDPSFWSPNTEIAVNGRLVVEGTEKEPVTLEPVTGFSGGIIAAPGSEVIIKGARIVRAEEGLLAAGGSMTVSESEITGCDVGIVINTGANFEAEKVKVTSCKVGGVDMRNYKRNEIPSDSEGIMAFKIQEFTYNGFDGVAFSGCADKDAVFFNEQRYIYEIQNRLDSSGRPEKGQQGREREFLGDYTVDGQETWSGNVIVNGRVTVPPGSLLTISEGTRVRFRKVDTNGDGLGEAELLVTGSIRVKGTEQNPVVFESAEENPEAGDWDKVSVISSDDPENSFEGAVFRYGVQALHNHFSRLSVKNCRFERNLRALQFQESEKTTVENCRFYSNKQAVRFRDSKALLSGCVFSGNEYAVHAFRAEVEFSKNSISGSSLGGMLAKECKLTMTGCSFDGGRNAVKVRGEGSGVSLKNNSFMRSAESLLSFSGANGELTANTLDKSGLDLVSVEDSPLVFSDNKFGYSSRHKIHLKGPIGVDAANNNWEVSPEVIGDYIYDKNDDPSLGEVIYKPLK